MIDLNCDMGELEDTALEEALMALVTSANIACGGHAGDAASMRRTVDLARRYGVRTGAHPSYPDREHFGRRPLGVPEPESIRAQVAALHEITTITHIKPHGALYNEAARNRAVAEAIARACEPWRQTAVLVGLAGSQVLTVWREWGFRIAGEGFADRQYEPGGSLRSRALPGALITEPPLAAAQALELAARAGVETICVHSDTPGSVAIARAVAAALRLKV